MSHLCVPLRAPQLLCQRCCAGPHHVVQYAGPQVLAPHGCLACRKGRGSGRGREVGRCRCKYCMSQALRCREGGGGLRACCRPLGAPRTSSHAWEPGAALERWLAGGPVLAGWWASAGWWAACWCYACVQKLQQLCACRGFEPAQVCLLRLLLLKFCTCWSCCVSEASQGAASRLPLLRMLRQHRCPWEGRRGTKGAAPSAHNA